MISSQMTVSNQTIAVFGAGGHGKVVADILMCASKSNSVVFVDSGKVGQKILGLPCIDDDEFFNSPVVRGIVAIGDNFKRSQVVAAILSKKPEFEFCNAIHPSAVISASASIGIGNVICANVCINPDSLIQNHCILNTGSNVDHDCRIDSFASIAPGATLGGNCFVGEFAAISIGATLLHKIEIGSHTVIGAGAIVLKNIGEKSIAFGVPAKIVRNRTIGEKYL